MTTTSPLSQCLPTTLASTGGAADAREAIVQEKSASYSAVRMLSLMPPSTATYRRLAPCSSSTSLIVPALYRVKVLGPAMARPGSTETRGTSTMSARHSLPTISASESARALAASGL